MFYLTLPSNSSTKYFPDNTLTHYFTKLPHAIDLSGGQWEVGLVEIQFSHTWFNMRQDEGWVVVRTTPDGALKRATLKGGLYETPDKLVKHLKLHCRKRLEDAGEDCDAIVFTYNEITQKVTLSLKNGASIIISPTLQRMLGLAHTEYEGKGHFKGDRVIDVHGGFYSLYVYCNLLEPRMVGDAMVPLLRIVPIRGKNGDMITKTYENVHYHPIQQKHFDTVEMDIRDDTGRPVSFERGKVVVTLHFRQRRSRHFL